MVGFPFNRYLPLSEFRFRESQVVLRTTRWEIEGAHTVWLVRIAHPASGDDVRP